MCGIVLEISKRKLKEYLENGYPFYEELNEIAHRGKDEIVLHEYKHCRVGYRRLATTNVNETPTFPGWMVYLNGEIYNYKELGYEGSEVDVLSQGFKAEGTDFVKRLNGVFFIVAIDEKENVLIFRDRYGVKPAYIWENDAFILVTSEIRSILKHPEYQLKENLVSVEQWFVFNNVFSHETMFSRINKVPSGSYIYFPINRPSDDVYLCHTYWKWSFVPNETMEYDYAVSEVRRLVTQAVLRQIPNEVKFGACLSGGVDSNIIAALIPTSTEFYTVTYDGDSVEYSLAKLSEKSITNVHYSKVEHLAETVESLEDLRVGASWPNYGMFKKMSGDGVKVCFDGSGADELFGGYKWRYDTSKDYYEVINRTKRKSKFCEKIGNHFLFEQSNIYARYEFDAKHFLQGVLLVGDKLSMAHTIELRVPFLDNDLVDFAQTIPSKFKENKKILKDAFKDLLPSAVLSAPKRGFTSPDWIEGDGNQANKWAVAAYNQWKKLFFKQK